MFVPYYAALEREGEAVAPPADPLEAHRAYSPFHSLAPLPDENVPAVANEVTFSWRDYLATNQDPSLKNTVRKDRCSAISATW